VRHDNDAEYVNRMQACRCPSQEHRYTLKISDDTQPSPSLKVKSKTETETNSRAPTVGLRALPLPNLPMCVTPHMRADQ